MNNLRKYIIENEQHFDIDPPQGHKERFISKYQKSKERKNIFIKISVSAAIITLIIWPFINISNPNGCSIDIDKYKRLFEDNYIKVYNKAEQLNPEDKIFIIETLDLINNQAISIEEQLPEFMNACEITQHTKEYYTNKIESLERISNTINQLINK